MAPDDARMLGIGLLLVVGSLLAQLARRLGLPAVSGYLVAGLALGAVPALFPGEPSVTTDLLRLAATGYAVFVVGLSITRARVDLRALACLVPCCLALGVGALVLALGVLPSLWPALPQLEGRTLAVVGLALAAASPTLVASVVEDHVQGAGARAAITAALALDGVILLLGAGLVGAPADAPGSALEIRLPTLLELEACVGVGVVAGGLLVQRRFSVSSFIACLGVGVLVLDRLASLTVAVLAMCLLAGIAYRERWPARADAVSPAVLHLALMVCFGLAAATVDVRQVLAALVPALALVVVRAAALGLGARVAGRLDPAARGPAGVRSLGAAPLLPQGGLVLLLLEAIPEVDDAWRAVVVAVVLVDAIVMPPWLRARFAAARPAELLGLDHLTEPAERSAGLDAPGAAHRQEPGAHVAAEQRGVLAVEHEAAHAQPQHVGRAVGGEQHLRRAAGRGVRAERRGDPGPLHGHPRIVEERRVQQQLARGVANLEVESHHVLLGQYCMRNGDLRAVERAQDHGPRSHGREPALDLAHPQVVAQPVAVLEPEHHRVEQVAQPRQPRDGHEPHRDRAGQAMHPFVGDQPT